MSTDEKLFELSNKIPIMLQSLEDDFKTILGFQVQSKTLKNRIKIAKITLQIVKFIFPQHAESARRVSAISRPSFRASQISF
jgi:hypothetical protein